MRKRVEHLSSFAIVATIFAMISWGSLLQAQQTDSQGSSTPQTQQPAQPQQPPDTQTPTPQQPDNAAQPSQSQDQSSSSQSGQSQASPSPNAPQQTSPSATSDQPVGSSEFVGTVSKQGDKYVFQDAASGQTYDIDHQDDVKKFDGKKVRVHGTLDPNTKIIHVQ